MESFNESQPFDPSFMGRAGDTASQLIQSSQNSAAVQQKRLQDYINHLMQVRDMARLAARGAGARGANGMQNPLSVYKSLNQLSEQAGIPIDAEIQKAIQGSNNIENTMNDMIAKAGSLYTQLAGIMQSRGGSGGGYTTIGGGYGSRGGVNGQGGYIDIRGNRTPGNPGDTERTKWLNDQYGRDTAPGFDKNNESQNPPWLTDFNGQQNGQPQDQNNPFLTYNNTENFNGGPASGPMNDFISNMDKYFEQLPGFNSVSPMENYAKDFSPGSPATNEVFGSPSPEFGGYEPKPSSPFESPGMGQFPSSFNTGSIADLGADFLGSFM